MARAYRRWLIAKGNVFSPSGEAIAKLVERLRKEKWIPDPAGGAKWERVPFPLEKAWLDHPDRTDLVMRFPVESGALKAPLTATPSKYTLELHRGEDFIVPIAKELGELGSECNCGEDLSFTWDDDDAASPFGLATGIFTECSECSRTFDPARFEAKVTDPATGKTTSVRGGAAHRFALVVAAQIPDDGPAPAMSPDLVALFEAEFGRSFYEIGALA